MASKSNNYSFYFHKLLKRGPFKNKKPSLVTIIFSLLVFLAIVEIFFGLLSPPKTTGVTNYYNIPLQPNETRTLPFHYPIATGQSFFLNISTMNDTSLKLTPIAFHHAEPGFIEPQIFSLNDPLVSFNNTSHLMKISQVTHFTIYRVSLKNPLNQTVSFDGFVTISGFNQEFLWIPPLLVLLYGFIKCIQFGIARIFKNNTRENEKTDYNIVVPVKNTYNAFFSRISSLWRIQIQETHYLKYIIIILLIWFIVQPMITFNYSKLCYSIQTLLENAEYNFISSIDNTIFLIAVSIIIDTSETIAAKIARKDIMITLSFPFKRSDWFFSIVSWTFILYSSVFLLILFIKAFIISMQIGLIYPIYSFAGHILRRHFLILNLFFDILYKILYKSPLSFLHNILS